MNPTVTVSFEDVKPKFVRPDILQHPNIPRYLSGVNPRTIMGREWWDAHRKGIYEVNNYHCFACGILTSEAPYRQWLEAHECYDYIWKEMVLRYRETVALCYLCHNFIHSGRLGAMWLEGHKTMAEVQDVLLHGFGVLHKAKLLPDQKAVYVAALVGGKAEDYIQKYEMRASGASVIHAVDLLAPGWTMEYEGKFYDMFGKETKAK